METTIPVERIPPEGREVEGPLSPSFLQKLLPAGGPGVLSLDGEGDARVRLERTGAGVLLRGVANGLLLGPCRRCLADVRRPLRTDFTVNLVSAGRREPEDEPAALRPPEDDGAGTVAGSFDPNRADEERFDGRTVELLPVIGEQLLLEVPMQLLCDDDCKGLCGTCGQDLNQAACGCTQERIDPRWAALRDIKLG